LESLRGAIASVEHSSTDEQRYAATLNSAADHLQSFLSQKESAIARLPQTANRVVQITDRIQANLDKPESRTPEILKRLAIEFTVATSFVVILRYTSGLYRLNYLQELKTMLDDDAARRFYVGFKGSGNSDEQRKAVLTAFMATPATHGLDDNPKAGPDSAGFSNEELSVLKEIIAALGKKL
jgi:hypothetical protein